MNSIKRPLNFDNLIGQQHVVDRLRITTQSCKKSESVHPHILIDGPPGLGKTTLAGAVANEMGVNLYTTNAANLRSVKSILPYLMRMTHRAVFFIDEIHRLPKLVEEFLYPVMEDFKINIILEKEPEEIDIPPFTIIGATTSGGTLSQPFYDRFTMKEHVSFYTVNELAKLAKLNSDVLNLSMSDEDLVEIAKRSKGTPRILNARLQWYNMCIASKPNQTVKEIFDMQGIDEHGLDIYDRLYLETLKSHTDTPLGLKSISAITGIAIDTIENSIEPYLIRKKLIRRTSQGRVLV
jgi:Holliday junction DNA helicase RuvB